MIIDWMDWQSAYNRSEIIAIVMFSMLVGFFIGAVLIHWDIGRQLSKWPRPELLLDNPYWKSIEELEPEVPNQRRHRIVAKLPSLSAMSICLCPGLPMIGSIYSSDKSDVILTKLSATSVSEDDMVWIVVSEYNVVGEKKDD